MAMTNDSNAGESTEQEDAGSSGEESRPQQAGEAGTTRFGMEDGDNTDVPATGGPAADEGPGENG
jgi:hypothetical protein